jgi:hypothetical protein
MFKTAKRTETGSLRIALAALLIVVPGQVAAQPAATTTPADFATAAAACIDAVSPDGLDPDKLIKRGWVKAGTDKAPFGDILVFTRANSNARIVTSVRPTGFCIADGFGQTGDAFDPFQSAVEEKFKAEFGKAGQTEVSIGTPGSAERRQGFVIGNAVGGLSSAMRPSGFNLRFTSVNTKFSGSPATFQTSRPPLSDAEMGENRMKERAEADYANGKAPLAEIIPMVNACATSLRTNSALPAADSWRKSIHSSGTPRSVAAIKTRDMKAVMAGMAHTQQQLYRVGKRGTLTKYFVRGTHMVCEALIKTDPLDLAAARAELVATLGLGKPQRPDAKVREFAAEYLLDDLTETYAMNGSTVAIRSGFGSRLEKLDLATPTFSVFVF